MKTLNLYSIDSVDHIVYPEDYEEITLSSPALGIFTDFRKYKPLVIDANTLAVEAQSLMAKAHVNLKIVLDENKNFCGVVDLYTLSERNIVKRVSNGEQRTDLVVTDLMLPSSKMKALDYAELEAAFVSDVVETLKRNGLQHCLVVDHATHEIRGLISSSDIARKLRIKLELSKALTFAEIFSALQPS